MDKVQKINAIYNEFKILFTQEKCPELFEAIKLAEEDYFPHSLGHFAILYTSVPKESRPKLMLVGNNPSWFINVKKNKYSTREEKKIALERVQSLESGVPSFSSYTAHNHRFAKRLETEYKRASVSNLLESTVGMNRFWVQTGSKPDALKKVTLKNNHSNYKKNKQLDELVKFCEEGTRKIIEIIEPHFLIVLGTPAKKLLVGWDTPKNISIHSAEHPDRSHDLSEVLSRIKSDLDFLT